jgi:uncharacterized protein (TIGR03437 family)
MRLASFGLLAVLAAGSCLEAAPTPIPPEIKNVVSFGYDGLQAGFDAAGTLYVASVVNFFGPLPSTATLIGPACTICLVVTKVAGGQLVHMTAIGGFVFGTPQYSGWSEQFAMRVDSSGDVFLAGGYASSSFPTTFAAFEAASATGGAYFLKLDPSGTKLLYSTFIGSNPIQTLVSAMALDAQGNIYIAGSTGESTFPTTPGALQPGSSIAPAFSAGFVSKFSPTGIFMASTLFGGGANGDQFISSIEIDASGVIHIIGGTRTFTTHPGFLARLNSSLTALLFSTMLSDTPQSIQASSAGDSYLAGAAGVTKIDTGGSIVYQTPLPSTGFGLLLLNDGSIAVAGSTYTVNFPVKNAIQPCPTYSVGTSLPPTYTYTPGLSRWLFAAGVFAMLDPRGQITFSTYLGGTDESAIFSTIPGPEGELYLTGWTNRSGPANTTDFPGGSRLAGLDWGPTAFVFELDLSAIPQGIPFPACLSTTSGESAPVAPGMIGTLYGNNLGPSTGVAFQLDSNGNVPTQLAGTSVTVGDLPAPILYAQDGQINFIVPQEVTGQTTTLCVESTGGRNCIDRPIQTEFPAIFYTPGMGYAILNHDGTLNTPSNPAVRGSYISVFGTGMGLTDRTLPDGSPWDLPPANLTTSVSATFIGPIPLPVVGCGDLFLPPCPGPHTATGQVLFAGGAPEEVVGVTQINVVIPDDADTGAYTAFRLDFGQGFSASAVVAIQ